MTLGAQRALAPRLATLVASAALTVGALAGCSAMPRLISADDLAARDRRILELEREVGKARDEAAALRRRVTDLERELEARPVEPPPAAVAPPTAPVDLEPLAAPPARVEVEESDLIDAEPATGGAPAPTAESDSDSSYEAALVALRDGRTEEAERLLIEFAEGSPSSDLADNAWFWLGESRAARGDHASAIDAYRTAIDRYPEGNKVPDTLLKLGVALANVGETGPAREAWQELVRRFPTTAAAEAALEKLGDR